MGWGVLNLEVVRPCGVAGVAAHVRRDPQVGGRAGEGGVSVLVELEHFKDLGSPGAQLRVVSERLDIEGLAVDVAFLADLPLVGGRLGDVQPGQATEQAAARADDHLGLRALDRDEDADFRTVVALPGREAYGIRRDRLPVLWLGGNSVDVRGHLVHVHTVVGREHRGIHDVEGLPVDLLVHLHGRLDRFGVFRSTGRSPIAPSNAGLAEYRLRVASVSVLSPFRGRA